MERTRKTTTTTTAKQQKHKQKISKQINKDKTIGNILCFKKTPRKSDFVFVYNFFLLILKFIQLETTRFFFK